MSVTAYNKASPANAAQRQAPFSLVAPLLQTALLLGVGGGFALAFVLTVTRMLAISEGKWWEALAQAHGHLQLYGWAGLFVLGVLFHFLPRLRGAALAAPRFVPYILGAQTAGLLLRVLSQPLAALTGGLVWQVLLIISGVLECVALLTAVMLVVLTASRGPKLSTRPAFWSVLPFFVGALSALGLASVINLINVVLAVDHGGLVASTFDELNTTLGLLGFLVPIALAMSARSLPMYAGLDAFPQKVIWPLAFTYLLGVALFCIGTGAPSLSVLADVRGLGMILSGIAVIIFVSVFIRLMSSRGRLPKRVSQLAPVPQVAARSYQVRDYNERNAFGPFVALVASAYIWAVLGSVLLLVDGVELLIGSAPLFAMDAIRHSFAIGLIALLICGVAPRMIPGFSGGNIRSARLVSATLWLGNIAAGLRVVSLLALPLLLSLGTIGISIASIGFGLSGPAGLALAICLALNLWPALLSSPRITVSRKR
ncbi:hypothetical protein EPA93_47600 [Ktedonosporobacter rubrisoli]|uniref:NnrS family protein n=1 Tax=Ktedonosporobacter rubrisoli TaxID=2509675 RepID=A0A4P6K561_KTERU|nr:hypothetical protein [Ktedonosporobacter rubrisoli]QBD83225.1 hypothetical protein EPA93_47600 [Ktedonosporobacter rubrisoli]